MSSSHRRQGSRFLRSRSTSNVSFRSSRSPPYRNAAQQTSDTGHRSPRRHRSSSPGPRSPSPSPSRPSPKKRFGMNVPTNQPRFVGKFDFEEKYPEDPINQEMGPNARVWRAFLDECEVFDADMVTEARDGLDLHLVFAGLFSAVLTTFVAQTSQALSTNFPALSTSLLVEMVALQRAQINGSPIDDILPGETTAGPSGFDVWVNALWFTSLALSLGTALIAVLVKQWLYQYMSMISGTVRDRSLIRHYRFDGLQRWHVLTIIGTLPIILHIALGLFLAGLVVFLIPLNLPVASIVGFITAVIYVMYIVSNILPLIYTHCPYRTPFSDILNVFTHPIRALPSLARAQIQNIFPSVSDEVSSICPTTEAFKTLKEAERLAATGDEVAEDVACDAALWLYKMTSNLPTKRVILESLGCLSDTVSKRFEEIDDAEVNRMLLETHYHSWDPEEGYIFFSIFEGSEKRAERILRSPGQSPQRQRSWKLDPDAFEEPFQMIATLLTHDHNVVVHAGPQTWNHDQFLVYLIRQPLYEPVRLPLVLWQRLISSAYTDGVPQLPGAEDDIFLLSLCRTALYAFSATAPKLLPFSGPVSITDTSVPLFQFIVDLLAVRLGNVSPADSFESDPLTKLFIMHDYAVSCLPSMPVGSNDDDNTAISIMGSIWGEIHIIRGLSQNDTHALCQRAENVVLRTLPLEAGWYDTWNDSMSCYTNILDAYHILCDSHVVSPEFFERLISDFCSSLRTPPFLFISAASSALQKIIHQPQNASASCTLVCTSPFLSTRTLTSLPSSRERLYPVVSAFISCLARGVGMPREAALRCMNDLCADPQRLYTVCRVIALGSWLGYSDDGANEEDLKQHLLHLAGVDPTHIIWTQRAHYMGMDPRDWPYLRLLDEVLDDEERVAEVKKRMKVGLAILDEFFASLDHDDPASVHRSRSLASPWKRVRVYVSDIGRSLHALPSNVADMERGLQLSGEVSTDMAPHL